MVFLELRRDSRVTTGNSGCLLCWPRQVQSSIRVAKESWGFDVESFSTSRSFPYLQRSFNLLRICKENAPTSIFQAPERVWDTKITGANSRGNTSILPALKPPFLSPIKVFILFIGQPWKLIAKALLISFLTQKA